MGLKAETENPHLSLDFSFWVISQTSRQDISKDIKDLATPT